MTNVEKIKSMTDNELAHMLLCPTEYDFDFNRTCTCGRKKTGGLNLAFTEEQAIEIRKTGLSVVQFKYCIKNGITHTIYTWKKIIDGMKKLVEIFRNTFGCFLDSLDSVKYLFEQVQDCLGHPVCERYRLVKTLGNMGYRKYDMWVATRQIYLARSNC